MKLYVVRHGQTDWNINQIIQGQKDTELKRAKKTSEIMNQNKKLEIVYRNELTERGLGDFEGKDCETEE